MEKIATKKSKEIDISTPGRGNHAAMQGFVKLAQKINKTRRASVLDVDKPIKELYHKMLNLDQKYNNKHE